MSKHIEWMLDKLGDEQMLELAMKLSAITREDVKRHILDYDFSEEEILEGLEEINIDPEDLG